MKKSLFILFISIGIYSSAQEYKLSIMGDAIDNVADTDQVKIEVKCDSTKSVFYTCGANRNFSFQLELDHFYEIVFRKANYYEKGFFVDTKNVPPERKKSPFSTMNIQINLYKINNNPIIPLSISKPSKMMYYYNPKKQNFEYDQQRLNNIIEQKEQFSDMMKIINEKPYFKIQFDDYLKKIFVAEEKAKEEKFQNELNQKEIEKRKLELIQSQLLNDKKEMEINLITQQKKNQELELVEKQNALIKKEIESERKTRQIAVLSKAEIENKLNLSNKELQLKQSEIAIQKKENDLLNAKKDKLLKEEEKKKQQSVIYAVIGVLLIVIIFSLFLFNRFRITQKQKKVIEQQKVLVDKAYETLHEKNKEVMDSINYASRIQRALITSDKYIATQLRRLMKNG